MLYRFICVQTIEAILQRSFHLDSDGVSDDGEVFSGPLDLGLPDGQDEVVLEDLVVDLEGHAVHQLVLKDDNWIGISDGSLEGDKDFVKRMSLRQKPTKSIKANASIMLKT